MKKEIEIKPKKPRLIYEGLEEKTLIESVPAQVIEVVYPAKAQKKEEEDSLFEKSELQTKITKSSDLPKNRLIWTNDNLVALKTLLDEKDSRSGEYKYRGKINLVYIDPPFMVQEDFVAENSIPIDIDKEKEISSVKEPTIIETIAYKDTWQNGLDSFLQMLRERLLLIKELLSDDGSVYIHLDWHTSHYVKILMDEIFDYKLLRNEIIWKYRTGNIADKQFMRKHDVILFYSKTEKNYFVPQKIKEYYFSIYGPGKTISFKGKNDGKDQYGDFRISQVDDVWSDIPHVFTLGGEWTPFPTQKPIKLIKRIINSSCPKNGIILDAFVGSGTACIAAEELAEELNCQWIGIDNSKFAIHTSRTRLIELNNKKKDKKGLSVYKTRAFTVENIGYYQRGLKWDSIQVGKNVDAYRRAIVEIFGGEYVAYSKLLHGKKKSNWVHIGPLSKPLIPKQIAAIAEEVEGTDFKKCYVLTSDFTAHLDRAVKEAKEKFGVKIIARIIPASAIAEIKNRLEILRQEHGNKKEIKQMPDIAFFSPLIIKTNKVVHDKEVMIELSGLEVDAESFLDSQKPEIRKKLTKWLEKENSWKSFVNFWAIDWNYEDLKDYNNEFIFENEWQSFRKYKGKKIYEDLVFKTSHKYEKAGKYKVAVKVTDVFGNDGIVIKDVVIGR